MRVRRPGTRLSADASSRRSPAQRRSRALNLLFVTLLCLGAASALLGGLSEPARAASCDQGSSLTTSDWIVTTPQVCRGILYTVDGSVIIQAGGSLTLINGGLDYGDVTKVPAVGLAQSWNLLKQGKLDGTISALGAGATAETNATIAGGARFNASCCALRPNPGSDSAGTTTYRCLSTRCGRWIRRIARR